MKRQFITITICGLLFAVNLLWVPDHRAFANADCGQLLQGYYQWLNSNDPTHVVYVYMTSNQSLNNPSKANFVSYAYGILQNVNGYLKGRALQYFSDRYAPNSPTNFRAPFDPAQTDEIDLTITADNIWITLLSWNNGVQILQPRCEGGLMFAIIPNALYSFSFQETMTPISSVSQ